MKLSPRFESDQNFLHPKLIKGTDGKEILYGPWRYKEIVREAFIISHQINTSYTDIMQMTPTERNYLLEFIKEDVDRQKENLDKLKQQHAQKK